MYVLCRYLQQFLLHRFYGLWNLLMANREDQKQKELKEIFVILKKLMVVIIQLSIKSFDVSKTPGLSPYFNEFLISVNKAFSFILPYF